jgi:hypothetical protein
VSPLPQAISIVMPFTASPREVEALSAWDKAMIVLFACDPRVHDRAMRLGYTAILHQGATAGVIQPGSDKPFDLLVTIADLGLDDDRFVATEPVEVHLSLESLTDGIVVNDGPLHAA